MSLLFAMVTFIGIGFNHNNYQSIYDLIRVHLVLLHLVLLKVKTIVFCRTCRTEYNVQVLKSIGSTVTCSNDE